MSKLPNIIQHRELESVLLKADKIARHYEKAANCAVCVIRPEPPDGETNSNHIHHLCRHCNKKNSFYEKHMEAVSEARRHGGSHVYVCPAGFVFWASPIYSGKRFAGAFVSGCGQGSSKNSSKVQALANMMLLCADQISRGVPHIPDAAALMDNYPEPQDFAGSQDLSFIQKRISAHEKELHPENFVEIIGSKTDEVKKIQFAENSPSLEMDMERMLLANLRRGDNVEAANILRKLLHIHYGEEKDNLTAFRLKALELAVLLSRATSDPNDINDDFVIETNNRYLKLISESSSLKEITDILLSFTEKMSGKIFSFHGVRHFSALRKAERFIWENYTKKLSLQEIADVSGLSAPYFSTIFKEEMGENLSTYLNRLRVEKAATMLATTNMPINKIARVCGFEDQSWFSKIFKNNTGLTPGKYREQ